MKTNIPKIQNICGCGQSRANHGNSVNGYCTLQGEIKGEAGSSGYSPITKIPSIEERVEDILSMIPKMKITVEVGDGENDTVDLEEVLPYELTKILTADRNALILEVRKVLASEGVLSMSVEKALAEINPTH